MCPPQNLGTPMNISISFYLITQTEKHTTCRVVVSSKWITPILVIHRQLTCLVSVECSACCFIMPIIYSLKDSCILIMKTKQSGVRNAKFLFKNFFMYFFLMQLIFNCIVLRVVSQFIFLKDSVLQRYYSVDNINSICGR